MGLVRLELRRGDDDAAGSVALVTLDDPARRNTMSMQLVTDLVGIMDAIEGDPTVGAVVVTGAPPAFCAGADLGNLGRYPGRYGQCLLDAAVPFFGIGLARRP